MAYNKTSEERKWNYWKEQEEKKLRELGMEEEKIQKLRQMDREDFLEERRYREHLDETMQDMDSIKEKDSELFASILGIFERYSLMQELIRRSLTLMVKQLLIGLVSIMNLVLQESSLIEVTIRIVRRGGIEDGNTSLYIDK